MNTECMRKHTMNDICTMSHALTEYLEGYINSEADLDSLDFNEAGLAVDIIKDLTEAEKNCAKAGYYETVVHAMNGGNDMGRMIKGIRADEELDTKYGGTETEPEKDAMECLEESLDTIKEIWASADTSLKQHLKLKLTNLVSTMTA